MGVVAALDGVERREELGELGLGEVVDVRGDQQFPGRQEDAEGPEAEVRGAVDDDPVPPAEGDEGLDEGREDALPSRAEERVELAERDVRRKNVEAVVGGGEDGVERKGFTPVLGEDHVFDGLGERGGIGAEAGGGAGLGVVIDEERGLAAAGEGGREVDGGGGLAGASLLEDDAENPGAHVGVPSPAASVPRDYLRDFVARVGVRSDQRSVQQRCRERLPGWFSLPDPA